MSPRGAEAAPAGAWKAVVTATLTNIGEDGALEFDGDDAQRVVLRWGCPTRRWASRRVSEGCPLVKTMPMRSQVSALCQSFPGRRDDEGDAVLVST